MIDLLSRLSKMAWSLGWPEIFVILILLGVPVTILVVVLVIVNSKKNKG